MSSLIKVCLNKSSDYFEGVPYNGALVDLLASSIHNNQCGMLTSVDLDNSSNLWRADESLDTSETSQLSMYETPLNCEVSPIKYESKPFNFDELSFDNDLSSVDSYSQIDFSDIPDELNPVPLSQQQQQQQQPITSSPNGDQTKTQTLDNSVIFEEPLPSDALDQIDVAMSIQFPALSDSLDSSVDAEDVKMVAKTTSPTTNVDSDHIDYNVLDSWLDKFCSQTDTEEQSPPVTASKEVTYQQIAPAPTMPIVLNAQQFLPVYDCPSPSTSTYSTISSVSEFNGSVEGSDSGLERPSISYLRMIAEAILSSKHEKANLTDIYGYVIRNYPYFESRKSAWRNSIRHNLSVNGCFMKNGRAPSGRGYFWSISEDYIKEFRRGDYSRKNRYQLQHKRRIASYVQRLPQQFAVTPVYVAPSNQNFAPNFITKYVPEAPVFTYRPT